MQHTYRCRDRIYSVSKLWALSKYLPIYILSMESEDIQHYLGARSWSGFKSPREVLVTRDNLFGHMSRILKADLQYPIILAPNYGVVDGMHRIAKAIYIGRKTIKCVRFKLWKEMEPAIISCKSK